MFPYSTLGMCLPDGNYTPGVDMLLLTTSDRIKIENKLLFLIYEKG